jgi:hypothetical protein
MRNAYRILFGKLGGKRPLGVAGKKYLNGSHRNRVRRECGLDSTGSG